MYWLDPAAETAIPVSPLASFTITCLVTAIFIFGVFPRPIMDALSDVPIVAPVLAVSR